MFVHMKEPDMERLLKPLASRRRLAILKYLRVSRRVNVTTIAEHIRLSLAATSRHLRLLETSGYVDKEQEGLEMYYRIREDAHSILAHILRML